MYIIIHHPYQRIHPQSTYVPLEHPLILPIIIYPSEDVDCLFYSSLFECCVTCMILGNDGVDRHTSVIPHHSSFWCCGWLLHVWSPVTMAFVDILPPRPPKPPRHPFIVNMIIVFPTAVKCLWGAEKPSYSSDEKRWLMCTITVKNEGDAWTLVGRGVHLVHQQRQIGWESTTHEPPSHLKSERPTAVITAAIITTTHPRIINRSLVACDAAGPTDGMLLWLLFDERWDPSRSCCCFVDCLGFIWALNKREVLR